MKSADFVLEFDDYSFPQSVGPWISRDDHHPPFTETQLKRMEKQGLIVFSEDMTEYRLTLKATKIHEAVR